MQRQVLGAAVLSDEAAHLAIGITGNISNRCHNVRLLTEPLQRHDRKELIDRPGVRHRLKEREVGKISLAQTQMESLQIIGNFSHSLNNFVDLDEDLVTEPLGKGPIM